MVVQPQLAAFIALSQFQALFDHSSRLHHSPQGGLHFMSVRAHRSLFWCCVLTLNNPHCLYDSFTGDPSSLIARVPQSGHHWEADEKASDRSWFRLSSIKPKSLRFDYATVYRS